MEALDIFATAYGKLGLVGVLLVALGFIIWKVYHDMKADKKALIAKVDKVEEKHDKFVGATHERTLAALEDNASSRTKLVSAISKLNTTCDGMSRALEGLPCNQQAQKRWTTPLPEVDA